MSAANARVLHRLRLDQFRSYSRFELELGGQSLFIFGANGAGKTNLLEAASILSAGKGLRGVSFTELQRHIPSEPDASSPEQGPHTPWSVSADLFDEPQRVIIGTGGDGRNTGKRVVKIDQVSVAPSRLSEYLRILWLTPALDRLFVEGRADRLKFFDRLIYAHDPSHAARVSLYDRALRERMRLLLSERPLSSWLDAIEARLSDLGLDLLRARNDALLALISEISQRQSAFLKADLKLEGLGANEPQSLTPQDLRAGFAASRAKDQAAGRSFFGPHRQDLCVFYAQKQQPAHLCSTGEQKALLLNIVLAQAARLKANPDGVPVILLLDEVAAHLDITRRHALFDETHDLALQTLFTGTDAGLFDGLLGRARGLHLMSSDRYDYID